VRSVAGAGGRLRYGGRDLELDLRPGETRRIEAAWFQRAVDPAGD
jgi:hypothetical protein